MFKKPLFYFTLLLSPLFLINCGDTKDDPPLNDIDACRPCDDQIGRLRTLLASLGCTESAAPEAKQDLQNACGTSEGEVYSYYLAEMCDFGSNQQPQCSNHGTPSANVLVTCRTSTASPPDTSYKVKISCDGSTTIEQEISPGGILYFPDFTCSEGSDAIVTCTQAGSGIETTTTVPFTFVRPSNYKEDREIELTVTGSCNALYWQN